MRVNGETEIQGENKNTKEVEEIGEMGSIVGAEFAQPPIKLVVGYALTSKKKKSFLQPKLIGLARNKGISFIAIDPNRTLSDQGPFDVVLQKLPGREWCEVIEDYRQKHPEVTVLDPPNAVQHLHNRQSMLQVVADLNLSDSHGMVCGPKQLTIIKDPLSIPDEVAKAGLKFPLELEPPLVLQEFVNHGGVLFKIYIIGEAIKVVRRFSLPNISKRDLEKLAGIFRFPRVSCAAASADDADLDPSIAELPERPLLERLARELRQRLGLRLFNVDMIREYGTKDVFYVIDINYFPGYGKMPEYEYMFTDFLQSLLQSKCKKGPAT